MVCRLVFVSVPFIRQLDIVKCSNPTCDPWIWRVLVLFAKDKCPQVASRFGVVVKTTVSHYHGESLISTNSVGVNGIPALSSACPAYLYVYQPGYKNSRCGQRKRLSFPTHRLNNADTFVRLSSTVKLYAILFSFTMQWKLERYSRFRVKTQDMTLWVRDWIFLLGILQICCHAHIARRLHVYHLRTILTVCLPLIVREISWRRSLKTSSRPRDTIPSKPRA